MTSKWRSPGLSKVNERNRLISPIELSPSLLSQSLVEIIANRSGHSPTRVEIVILSGRFGAARNPILRPVRSGPAFGITALVFVESVRRSGRTILAGDFCELFQSGGVHEYFSPR